MPRATARRRRRYGEFYVFRRPDAAQRRGFAPSPDPDESLTEPHGPSDEGRSLEAIVSRALAQPPGRERFLTVLQAATIARQHADTEVAQALLDSTAPRDRRHVGGVGAGRLPRVLRRIPSDNRRTRRPGR